jgi:hypothetical protein
VRRLASESRRVHQFYQCVIGGPLRVSACARCGLVRGALLGERAAMADLRALATSPIRLPPVDLLTERVFHLRALTESPDVQSARTALRTYFKDGTITMTPEPFGDGQAYVARAEFLPLVLLNQNAGTPSEPELGGRCLRSVARGRNAGCIPRYHWGSSADCCLIPLCARLAYGN